tara:strand:- start:76 stop:630 length:555 start_codon:yes stop_codon:yes gene_type:complete
MGRYSLGGGAGGDVNATTVTITDNESGSEENTIVFVADAAAAGGDVGLESDGTLTYNPSNGKVTATGFIGALTGNASGSSGSTTGNAATATVATTVTITDNESSTETNAIIFTAGGAKTGGNLGLESDGDLHYAPNSGTLTATVGSFGDVMFANGWYFTELEKLDMGTGMALCRPDGEIAHVFR